MKITKEAGVQGLSQIGEEDLALINALARRELKAEEVYTFAVRLCDNDIDRDGERFAVETLEELAGLFIGAPGIFDHQWSAKGQTARIYRTELAREEGVLTRDGQEYCYLKGYAYMVRTAENESLIAEIDGGIKREVSVGCSVERMECSICGADMRGGGMVGAGGAEESRDGGESAARETMERLAEELAGQGAAGLTVLELESGQAEFLESRGLYRLPVKCVCRGWLTAAAREDGAFVDIEVRGKQK